jgi:hypothetical protein
VRGDVGLGDKARGGPGEEDRGEDVRRELDLLGKD